MYSTFLQFALDKVRTPDHALTTGEGVIRLSRCRDRLALSRMDEEVPAALADQLSYDVALISLARQREIAVNVQAFDQPLPERLRLERAIETTGVELYRTIPFSSGDSGGPT